MKTMLPIAMSDIHVHLAAQQVEELFGKGPALTKWRALPLPATGSSWGACPRGASPAAWRAPRERRWSGPWAA